MPLGKEWTLNHWIYRAATSCHREISAFEQNPRACALPPTQIEEP